MIYIILFFIGSCLASFAYCFSFDWVHQSISFTRRSHCDHCHLILGPFDLIPIFSILFSFFRCRQCQKFVSPLYLVVEVLGGVLSLVVYYLFSDLGVLFVLSFSLVCLLMIFCDCHAMVVPDLLQLMLLIHCLYFFLISPYSFSEQLILSLCVFISLISLNLFKKNSIGGADIKALTLLSLLIPLEQFPIMLFVSSFMALLYIVGSRPIKQAKNVPFPFIPFIFLGFFVAISLI